MTRLGQWLMYQVHGIRVLRERRKPRRGPARNGKYRAFVRQHPCLICRSKRSEAAHTGKDGGMGMKASDYSCVPLCREDHRQGALSYHTLGRERFERAHNLNLKRIADELVAEFLWLTEKSRKLKGEGAR